MALSDLLVKVGIDSSGFRSGISDLRSQSASLRSSMAQMAGTIRDQVKELNAMARAGKQGTDEFKKLQAQIKQNENAFKGMGKEVKYLDQQLRNMEGPKLGNLLGNMGQAVTGGIIGGGVAQGAMAAFGQIQAAIGNAVRVGVDFDDQLRKIAATSGASSQQMGMLRDAAIEWGAKTSFSASEAAQAMQFMAQAGWNTEQTISGLPGVLNLAASSGEDLGTVAGIVTNNLNAFKLQAKDAGRFADVLAAAAAASATDVGNMGATFKFVAPTAGALGFTIEDTAIAIGLLANSGIKATQAGTGLNAIFANMAKPTADMQKTMTELNISLTDNAGQVKPLRQLIVELRDAFKTLTPAQQLQAATSIAGKEAMAELLTLVTSTDDAIASMTQQIDANNGVASRMAETMEGGLGGSLRRLSGAWESFTLNMLETDGLFKNMVDRLADLVSWLATTDKTTLDVAKAGDEVTKSMAREQAEMNALFNVLVKGNLSQESRKKLIDEINQKYGPYIGNLIDEKSKLEDITAARVRGNEEFRKAIRLQASESMLSASMEKRVALEEKSLQLELDLEAARQGRLKDIKAIEYGAMMHATQATAIKMVVSEMERNKKAVAEADSEYEKISKRAEQFGTTATASAQALVQAAVSATSTVKETATESSKSIAKAAQTAKDVFANLQSDLAKSAEFYRIMDDEAGGLADRHALLEGAIKKAWSAGGAEAESVIRNIKAQLEDMTKARLVPEVAALPTLQMGGVQSMTTAGAQMPFMQKPEEEGKSITDMMKEQEDAALALEQRYMSMGQAAFNAFEQVGMAATSASGGVRAFGMAAVSASLDAARGALVEAIMNNTKWLTKTMGPLGIPIAMAGVGALFGLLKGAIGKSKGVQLAEGGIITGRTLAEVGEYPGASFNPEVVAPLDKLQAMLDVGGATHVTGTFRVNGSDLVVALDNAQRKMNKFRV